MILYRSTKGNFVQQDDKNYPVDETSIDALVANEDLHGYLSAVIAKSRPTDQFDDAVLLAPI